MILFFSNLKRDMTDVLVLRFIDLFFWHIPFASQLRAVTFIIVSFRDTRRHFFMKSSNAHICKFRNFRAQVRVDGYDVGPTSDNSKNDAMIGSSHLFRVKWPGLALSLLSIS